MYIKLSKYVILNGVVNNYFVFGGYSMVAIIVGIVLIAFALIAVLPFCLNWSQEIIAFLKGCAPVLSAFIGLLAIFVGVADIKDKQEAKKEEAASQESE